MRRPGPEGGLPPSRRRRASPGLLARLAWAWWVYLPLGLRRLADGLATTLVDGLYLVAWPLPAFLLPPLVLLLGVLLRHSHPGYVVTVTESIPMLLLLVVLGTASGHLGLAFLAGYVLGDVFLFNLERAWPACRPRWGRCSAPATPRQRAVALVVDQGAYWLPLVIQLRADGPAPVRLPPADQGPGTLPGRPGPPGPLGRLRRPALRRSTRCSPSPWSTSGRSPSPC